MSKEPLYQLVVAGEKRLQRNPAVKRGRSLPGLEARCGHQQPLILEATVPPCSTWGASGGLSQFWKKAGLSGSEPELEQVPFHIKLTSLAPVGLESQPHSGGPQAEGLFPRGLGCLTSERVGPKHPRNSPVKEGRCPGVSKAPSGSTLVVTLWPQELISLWGSSQFTAGASGVWVRLWLCYQSPRGTSWQDHLCVRRPVMAAVWSWVRSPHPTTHSLCDPRPGT